MKMNYFVPPQGIPGLVQMPQVVAGQMQVGASGGFAPQVLNAAASHPQLHMMPQAVQPHLQPGLIGAPRVVPVAQAAQLQQLNYAVAVSQYQQAQVLRQQSIQRAITSVALSTPRTTASVTKTPPPHTSTITVKPTCANAEVQTPEYDPNPEADSSTKARIITHNLAMCSTIVSSDYRHLQSRILTWGEPNERQALEISRVKADFGPTKESSPRTAAAVIIMDDGQVQLNISGTVIKSQSVIEKEENHFDEQKLRDYLNMLGESYTFCQGLTQDDLQSVSPVAVVRCNNLIKRQNPVKGAFSVDCLRWLDTTESDGPAKARCSECGKSLEKLSSSVKEDDEKNKINTLKRPLEIDDLPSEPKTKRPRLLEAHTAKVYLDSICDQVKGFQAGDDINREMLNNFFTSLTSDINNVRGLYEDVQPESEQPGETSKESQDATKTSPTQNENTVNGIEENCPEDSIKAELDTSASEPAKLGDKEKSVLKTNEENNTVVNGDTAN